MAKSANTVKSVKLTITTTPQIKEFLEELVVYGFHGKNPAEAAERLLADTLREKYVKNGRTIRFEEPVG